LTQQNEGANGFCKLGATNNATNAKCLLNGKMQGVKFSVGTSKR
jgi:hypothetical protein